MLLFFGKFHIFNLMMDEITNSTKELKTIIICWITENFKVSVQFLGLYGVPSNDAATLSMDTYIRYF